MAYKPYTKEDERFLVENYSEMPLRELAAKLNRPYDSVRVKGNNMGLRRRSGEGQLDDIVKLFIKYYCTNDRTETIGEVYKLIGDELGITFENVRTVVSTNFPLAVSPLPK